MNVQAPFRRDDLRELAATILDQAEEVVAMREIAAGEHFQDVIGLRHDVDNTLEPCRELALWEERHGYRATYYVLHDSPYWDSPELRPTLEEIASRGHEIAIHANAIAVALQTGEHPDAILERAIARLSEWGHEIRGVVAHGDPLCHMAHFVNDEQFVECARPDYGEPDRELGYVGRLLKLQPRPLADFGLTYEAHRCGAPRAMYLSDSGGRWNERPEAVAHEFPYPSGQLHILLHPCWWTEAFPVKVAA